MKPRIIVLTGYGINCEEEVQHAFGLSGGKVETVHINDLIDRHKILSSYQILAIPGGFSFGDDTGSGNAYANRMKNHLWEQIIKFVTKDTLVIGICNGFQILVNLGLLPAFDKKYGNREVALTFNKIPRYMNRWVDVRVVGKSPWLRNIKHLSMPIAHGEGRFFAAPAIINKLKHNHLIVLEYEQGEICTWQHMESNPNGSLEQVAGITDESGRVFGLMPHPDRALWFTQRPDWTYKKELYMRKKKPLPVYGDGLEIFKNAIRYFR